MSRRTWFTVIPVVALLALVGGPWVYINLIREDAPARLTLDDATTTTAGDGAADTTTTSSTDATGTQAAGIEGTWAVTTGSQAGYRVQEVLFGQEAEAVGRTTGVTGTLAITGTTVTSTEVVVDMTTVTSSESRRDGQFQGRIMDTATYPTATFTLIEPIELGSVPADGEVVTHTVTGDLTLRGVTRSVTFELSARRNGATIEANGTIAISFDDFEIPDASGGPASVGRDGELELLLVFTR
ncbi:MAG: YceI family protein [Acidimicrobiales bacterium]